MSQETSRWFRLTIEIEEPAMNKAGLLRWLEHVVTGVVDGEEREIEPVQALLVPDTINWSVEEFEGPRRP